MNKNRKSQKNTFSAIANLRKVQMIGTTLQYGMGRYVHRWQKYKKQRNRQHEIQDSGYFWVGRWGRHANEGHRDE